MNKQSLLEVDFDHLAWEPVDPQITSALSGTLTPIKMARGKHEVYLNVKFDTSTPTKESEYNEFKKAFEEIDTKRKDKVSDLFLGAFGEEAREEEITDDESREDVDYDTLSSRIDNKKEKVTLDIDPRNAEADGIEDENLSQEERDAKENEVINGVESGESKLDGDLPEDITIEKVKETYDTKQVYKNYVVNIEEGIIDSGWNDIEAAKQRLDEIETSGAENYTIQPYGIKLFTIIGDPTTEKWKTYGLSNFYIVKDEVVPVKKDELIIDKVDNIDSGWSNRAEANKRLKEIETLIERHNKLHAPDNNDDEDNVDVINNKESDLAILDKYSIIKGSDAIKKYGFEVTHKEKYTPIEKYISAVEKEVKKINESLMLESILTELAEPKALDSFYLTFGFNRDFNPSDNSGRVGHSDEYTELEIYLKDFISKDGTVEISSKEFRKACDRAKAKRAYQSTIKTLNHTADYFHNNLGFGEKEDLSKLGKGRQSDYNTKEGSIDLNPSKGISPDFSTAQGGTRESNRYDVKFNDKGKGKLAGDQDGKEARKQFAEDIGIDYVRKAKERLYTVINDPAYKNEFKSYVDYADDVESYIDKNYHPDKAHLSAQFRGEIEEFLKAAEDIREAHKSIMHEIKPRGKTSEKRSQEKTDMASRGQIGNTPIIRSGINSGTRKGISLFTTPEGIEAKRKYYEIYKSLSTKISTVDRSKKTNELYAEKYGESFDDTMAHLNRKREEQARSSGGFPKMKPSGRQDNKEITKPSRKKQ